ncbi:Fur family transcriptional regulator [Paenibacillus sp. YYML68]|uniref:Fur family transcriptional regulator n=1 Tax=Paenibacillus sp. YYML68 TaxID=2909250 RepID=UPI0024916E48|nr:Fur family transcriptional regulator [Paenibacillus sp. YYML68]
MKVTRNEAIQKLKELGIRMTTQRELLLHYLYERLSHPSAEQLYEAIYADYPKVVSITTVYNNLRLLREQRLVKEFYIHHTGTARYDTNVQPHHHLYCTSCHSVTDYAAAGSLPTLASGRLEPVQELPPGFITEQVYLEISGMCEACSQPQPLRREIAI